MIVLFIWALLAIAFEKPKNKYIDKHKEKFKNDSDYTVYEKWCFKNGEIPMNKESVIKEIEDKENQIYKLWKR